MTKPAATLGYYLPTPRFYSLHSILRVAVCTLIILVALFQVVSLRGVTNQTYIGLILKNASVVRVPSDGPGFKAGIRKGDQIISINGVETKDLKRTAEILSRIEPGDRISYVAIRNGQIKEFELIATRIPKQVIWQKASIVLVALSFIVIGLVVYVRRSDRIALLFCLLSSAFGFVLMSLAIPDHKIGTSLLKAFLSDLIQVILPPLFLHFFLVFPVAKRPIERHPYLQWLIYAPAAMLFTLAVVMSLAIYQGIKVPEKTLSMFEISTSVYFGACLAAGLVSFVHGYLRVKQKSLKAKLKSVVWGTVIGISPIVAVQIVLNVRPDVEIPGERFTFLPLVLVPLTYGHAIIRYGLLDLRLAARRSLVYSLLVAILATIYFIIVYGIGRVASRFIGSTDLLFSVISIFMITLLASPLRSRIKMTVDRIFFRDEYRSRKLVKQISQSLIGMVSLDDLVSYVAIRAAELTNAQNLSVYLVDEAIGVFAPRYAIKLDHVMLKSYEIGSPLMKYLETSGGVMNIERRLASRYPLPFKEINDFVRTGTALIVPLVFKSKMLGFMAIGSKTNEEYYTATDIDLIETLSAQVSMAIENTRMYADVLEKQKMENELLIARQIQQRFLPKSFPDLPYLKVEAMNYPSRHVGGDYYDIYDLGSSRIGAVIADVSGKGVPAALLMASLHSTLRSEAKPDTMPSQVVSRLNKEIFEHTGGQSFITLFYAVIDAEKSKMIYCNAGHVPPIVLTRDNNVRYLDNTDLVLGVDPCTCYQDTEVKLCGGDIIFLYTDGIVDEFDEQEYRFGEEKLLRVLRTAKERDLAAILEAIRQEIVKHTSGKIQDDLSAMILRFEASRSSISPCIRKKI